MIRVIIARQAGGQRDDTRVDILTAMLQRLGYAAASHLVVDVEVSPERLDDLLVTSPEWKVIVVPSTPA